MEWVFWVALAGALYSYFLYPLILLALPKPLARRDRDPAYRPSVSLIITAYNEAARIGEKIEDSLRVNYPEGKLEIIVASDASTDDTDAIVNSYGKDGVRLVRADQRLGKEYAQWCAIRAAGGDVLVFSDVATRLEPDSITEMVANFADERVGAVSSEDRFYTPDGRVVGEGAYVKYEMWLRRLESGLRGLVGLSGSFFAARRELCQQWDIKVPSDFNTALNCARAGKVAVTDSRVLGFYANVRDESREYQRKLRTVIRGMAGVFRRADILNPFRYGLFAFQVWSHKPMRWAVPWFLLVVLAASVVLVARGSHPIYTLALLGQIGLYGLVGLAHVMPWLRGFGPVRIPYFFAVANLAIAHATVAYVTGQRVTVWEPSKR